MLKDFDLNVYRIIEKEKQRQNSTIELIASENFVSENVLEAVGSCLTNKYTEGYPNNRYYGGCKNYDDLEELCKKRWQQLFNTNYHVNVQPHSGSNANFAAYMSVLKPNDLILSMSLDNGSHLTHGSPVNFSGKIFNTVFYHLDENGYIDMDDVYVRAMDCKPKLIVAGASAYSREIDYKRFAEIAHECGAYLMVDMAHPAGLISAGLLQSPFGYADIITTTTQKTLRGTRGGLIFCKPELAKKIDNAVFPCTQGGALQHIVAGKAVTALECMQQEYKEYAKQVVANSKAMCNRFIELGYDIVSGGTDNHMFMIDLTKLGLTGLEVQECLDKYGITLNKNAIPNDTLSPKYTSGVRIGTSAMTTKGYKENDFIGVANMIDAIIKHDLIKNKEEIN